VALTVLCYGPEAHRRGVRQGNGTELAADPEHLPLTFGMLMYEGDPESIGQFIAAMPADAGLIIRRLARPAFTTHSQRVHGTPTPPRSTEL